MEDVLMTCDDGYKLSAAYFKSTAVNTKKYPILICSATGLRKSFYVPFAKWLTEQGYNVLTFDYRGIGDSLYVPLHECNARYTDWATLDIPTAIDCLLDLTKSEKVLLIGHSVGGQLLGIVPNIHKVAKAISINSSTGYMKALSPKKKVLAFFMYNIFFPGFAAVKGYCPTKAVGFGQNLPKDVGLQWAKFSRTPHYIKPALGKTVFHDLHEKIDFPITFYRILDDDVVTHATVQGLIDLFPNTPTKLIELSPDHFGYKSIGHSSMFKADRNKLWPVFEKEVSDLAHHPKHLHICA